MRQLVTLNARSEEHSKYLDIIMVMVNDLKDKLQQTNPLETSINGRLEVENVFSKFPVADKNALNEITNDLNNNSSLYDQIVSYINIQMIYLYSLILQYINYYIEYLFLNVIH